MSYNLARKVRRGQMKVMIDEFMKQEKLSNKKLINLLFDGRNIHRPSLNLKFARMINIASAALEKETQGSVA
jgi:hypothetical protein